MDQEKQKFADEQKAATPESSGRSGGNCQENPGPKLREIYREIRTIQENTTTAVKDNKELEAIRKRIKEKEKNLYQFGSRPKDYQGAAGNETTSASG